MNPLFSSEAGAATAKDVVNGKRASPEENQAEGKRREKQFLPGDGKRGAVLAFLGHVRGKGASLAHGHRQH